MKKGLFVFWSLCIFMICNAQNSFEVKSPNGKLLISIDMNNEVQFSLTQDNDLMIKNSPINMKLSTGEVWGKYLKIINASTIRKEEEVVSPFSMSKKIYNIYNELTISFKGEWSLKFRAYDDCMAYRFVSDKKATITY